MQNAKVLPKITIVGAGNVGATAAQLVLAKNLGNVVLIDIAVGTCMGKALDLMHMRQNEGFAPGIIGTGSYEDTANSDIVVVTAGVPRRPGMTREDLLKVNAKIVQQVLEGALSASPNAIFIFVTNPLDIMTNLAYQLAHELAGVETHRLMGMGGVLDSARFSHCIAKATGAQPGEVECMVIGAHGEGMLPLPRLARVNGRPLESLLSAQEIEAVVADTINGGAAVVELLQNGSAFYAPASSIVRMVEQILCPTGQVLSVCAGLHGEYGLDGLHVCVPAMLGPQGVERVLELDLSAAELSRLQEAAGKIRGQLARQLSIAAG